MVLKGLSEGPVTGPWYVKILQTVLTTSGPIALIATLLVAFIMWMQYSSVAALQSNMQSANVKMTAFAEVQKNRDEAVAKLLQKLVTLSRQQCINTAKTPEAAQDKCSAE